MENKHILNWFRFADTVLAAVEHLLSMRPLPYEIICFHCQQSVEKYLKGYLIYKGIEQPPKIHDLAELCNKCADFNSQFDNILKKCDFLSDFGVQPRYPDEIEMNENIMRKSVQYAKEIKEFSPLATVCQQLEKNA